MSSIGTNCQRGDCGIQQPPETPQAGAESESASVHARQRRRIAELEGKVETLESGRSVKERYAPRLFALSPLYSLFVRQTNYYLAQGRAIRRVVTLFDNIEDLVAENDRRYEYDGDEDATLDQDRLQTGYTALVRALAWFVKNATDMENDDFARMLKTLRLGADSARGDDTSKLKTLVSSWVNLELKPTPPVEPDDKHHRGFINDACGKLLCPAELDWSSSLVKAGIRNRSEGHAVTEMSFPAFLYENYTANPDNLEEGLFKGKILVQAYKAVFTSPSSAKDVEDDGDGADVIENNRRATRASSGAKLKKHVRFALSSVTSWRSVDGDFDYIQFWKIIVDFFEVAPGREARRRVNRLLEWWTRKVFGRNRREELSDAAKANLSVNALARQRAQLDDASFDSS
ncbi:hypothetical protein DEU56DRAFT_749373 [Suillus clintonianus]|uniref:uncharacterized protein n=1 Tax=Suillus clintonianus TaxID=1904413 RepID=UPI001B8780AE|nr:uncharacterized protein DEU56DRAFT_749373 [Suillus clintonianus]KAG2112424.1 hypothetical protein DEU56DRAFT_749373 [Suillus clintonianus]